ncbi:hypothetical protein Q4561_14525 [Alteromonas sp. 1_MG-2023]|uniref:hypothetical protein n=1 Tax=Alteromonas sp. 1_MG-2023 TaxID=3062669 RepID=UPI0026E47EE4|nr:hypothetical protein [Alteromonas sp. 1_MG-2023]MDO6568285.1 hypothetical protein [Alteromonas sp. 1_MG-2023]
MKKFALSTLAAAMLASPAAHTLADAYIGDQLTEALSVLDATDTLTTVVGVLQKKGHKPHLIYSYCLLIGLFIFQHIPLFIYLLFQLSV